MARKVQKVTQTTDESTATNETSNRGPVLSMNEERYIALAEALNGHRGENGTVNVSAEQIAEELAEHPAFAGENRTGEALSTLIDARRVRYHAGVLRRKHGLPVPTFPRGASGGSRRSTVPLDKLREMFAQ